MKKVTRKNVIDLPYSLHDGVVTGFEVLAGSEKLNECEKQNGFEIPNGCENLNECEIPRDKLLLEFEHGFVSTLEPYMQVEGKIEFAKVDWDFSFAYIIEFPDGSLCGNQGNFTGHKMELLDFIQQNKELRFEIIDETYGYNTTKLDGYLWGDTKIKECRLEIYHLGDMSYIVRN